MKQGTIKISKISTQFISIHVLGQVQSRLHKRLKRLGEKTHGFKKNRY